MHKHETVTNNHSINTRRLLRRRGRLRPASAAPPRAWAGEPHTHIMYTYMYMCMHTYTYTYVYK